LPLHLLVASSELDVVAVCLHAQTERAADLSHEILAREHVPFVRVDRQIEFRDDDLSSFKKYALLRALQITDYNVKRAARLLDVSERTVRNWRKEWGV
jgi:transcriptional regulator of acetoin/glycerol metabolism